MGSARDEFVLVTGAAGHVGHEVCRLLRTGGTKILPVDVDGATSDIITCDLRSQQQISRLFESHKVRAVIHLAAILPSSFHSDPFAGVDVNLTGCFELMRQALNARIRRFVFASSMSVYGSSLTTRPLTEDDPAVPDEPYGASKRVVELVGQTLASRNEVEFVSLRIARIIGLGIKRTSSPWRSQIFEPCGGDDSVRIPFAPTTVLSLVHVEDVARMLIILAERSEVHSTIYNTPVELWEARRLKELIEEVRGRRVDLGPEGALGGPIGDGSRFVREFGVQIRGLRERLSDPLH